MSIKLKDRVSVEKLIEVMEIVSIEDGYNENHRRPGRKRKAAINE